MVNPAQMPITVGIPMASCHVFLLLLEYRHSEGSTICDPARIFFNTPKLDSAKKWLKCEIFPIDSIVDLVDITTDANLFMLFQDDFCGID